MLSTTRVDLRARRVGPHVAVIQRKDTLRDFDTFVGIDLGGARGKTTALARVSRDAAGGAVVESVSTRDGGGRLWRDEVLMDYLGDLGPRAAVAIDAPLTAPACVRCVEAACPGQNACEVPAVVWLRTEGAQLVSAARARDRDRIAAVPAGSALRARVDEPPAQRQAPAPYTHRCTEVFLCHERGLLPREALGRGPSPVSSRAGHLRRQVARLGFSLNRNLLEVSPRSTVHALFGRRAARGYRRDADPWHTRAEILDGLDALSFSPKSCLSKEEVLRSDHCFDALLSAYTAYLWARDGWTLPDDAGALADDGWIWVPPGD